MGVLSELIFPLYVEKTENLDNGSKYFIPAQAVIGTWKKIEVFPQESAKNFLGWRTMERVDGLVGGRIVFAPWYYFMEQTVIEIAIVET